ncbi:MAG: HlyD family secretion protein, partial [Bacteroidota bacterium]
KYISYNKKAEKKLQKNQLFIQDLRHLLGANPQELQSSNYKNEWGKYKAGERELQIKLDFLQVNFNQQEYLYNEKVIAEIDFLESKNKLQSIRSQLDLYKQKARNNWQIEITQLEIENENIRSSLKQLDDEKSQYTITAPASGSLLQTSGIQSGSFISPGQELAEISPDDKLIAECYVPSKDIGYIKKGQPVRFQFDAYDYNQWGLLEGEVTKISDAAIVIDNQPVFKVRCQLPSTYLQLKSGQQGFLKNGMTLTGRFLLTERTLFQLLFDKVDDWLNPKQI